jgi:hypothetical protein
MGGFLMTTKGLTEDEAISSMSVAVDFGIMQVVDGNLGRSRDQRKSIFAGDTALAAARAVQRCGPWGWRRVSPKRHSLTETAHE